MYWQTEWNCGDCMVKFIGDRHNCNNPNIIEIKCEKCGEKKKIGFPLDVLSYRIQCSYGEHSLKDVKMKDENGWIQVGIKHPENGEIVWCWNGEYVFTCLFEENDGYFEKADITHWQSVVKPQPPKEAECKR